MSLYVAAVLGLFILSSFVNTKRFVAAIALVVLFYVHLPIAIGLSLVLAVIFYYS